MSTVKRLLGVLFAVLLTTFSLVTPTASAATDLLPDLRMQKPSGFVIENAGSEKRLRFDTVVGNHGSGAFHVRGDRPNTSTAKMSLTQRVQRSDGSVRSIAIPLSESHAFWGGDGHNHWHIYRLQEFTIRMVDPNDPGLLGPVVGRGAKIGFCFFDNTKINLSLPGAPQTPRYTHCGTQTALSVTMGLSVGWGDIYGKWLNYQWIKINGLPDGKYRIHVTADPGNDFLESNETNNRSFTTIRITGNTVSVVG